MSSLESSGFPSPPSQPVEEHEAGAPAPAPEPFASLTPLQPFEEVQPPQPLQPLDTPPVESYTVEQVEPVELQPLEPLQPLPALEPLQPTMPPPLPLLTAAEPAVVEAAPSMTPPAPRPEEVANLGVPLGTLIFRAGLLTEEQLEEALQEGVRSGKRLGEVLLESGLIDERDLGRLLADQKGLRFVELSGLSLDPAATALLSAEKAHMFAALPLGFEDGVPLVAVADPSNELVTENLRRALGSEPRLVVASRSDLHSTIDRHHGTPAVEEPVVVEEEPVAFAPEPEPVAAVAEPEPFVAPVVEQMQPVPAAELPPLAPPPVAVEPVVAPQPEPEPQLAPEPVAEPALRPVEVAHVAPAAPAEPAEPEAGAYETVAPLVAQPEPAPQPVIVPEPEPVAIEVAPVVETAPEPAPEPVVEATPELTFSRIEEEPDPQAPVEHMIGSEQELPTAVAYDVSLRLSDGERVAVGSFSDPQKAREYAREVVKHLSNESEGWPFFSGRFMRPDTIVSVDIVPVGEPDRWLGSAVRSNWASRLNR